VRHPHVVRPPGRLQALEALAFPVEALAFGTARPWLRLARHGDGGPVLVLPGFLTTDRSTAALRGVLREHGHRAHAWRLGRNLGPTRRVVGGLRRRLLDVVERDGAPVSIVGQSLGGVYGRLLARERPDLVRQVISLGSPYRMTGGPLDPLGSGERDALAHAAELEEDRPPLEVPATSIYSRTDGIAPWHTCIDGEGGCCENIEVRGTHLGMAINPAVVLAVLDRLAQAPGTWTPFVPPLAARAWYPRARYWRADAARAA
jgi:pimeloyl-ACP methyl ester carboxylesterase